MSDTTTTATEPTTTATTPATTEQAAPPATSNPEADAAAAKAKEREELAQLARDASDRYRERRAWKREREAMAREREAIARDRAEKEELAAKLEAARKDPLAFASEAGVGADELIKRAVRANTPEEQIETLRAEIRAMKQAEHDRAEAAKREAEESQRRQASQTVTAAQQRFVSELGSSAERFPIVAALAQVAPGLVLQAAEAVGREIDAYNRRNPHEPIDPTQIKNDDLASLLEERFAPLRTRLTGAAQGSGNQQRTGAEPTGTADGNGKPKSATLTNSMQGDQARKEVDISKMTRQEQNAYLVKLYESIAQGRGAPTP